MYCIYKATNKVNGKVYIGKTNNFAKRKKEHLSEKKDIHIFQRAIKKYGAGSFDWEIIESCIPTNEIANEREKYWIKKYNSYFKSESSNGYNMTLGGDGGSMWNVKRIASYSSDGNLLKVFSSLTEAAKFYRISGTSSISRCCKDFSKTCKGKRFSYIYGDPKEKLKVPKSKSTRAKKVYQYTKNGEFVRSYNSVQETENSGFNRTSVIGCANGTYKTAGGFVWRYSKQEPKKAEPLRAYGNIKIMQFDSEKNLIGEFCSCSDAARKCGISSNKVIHRALSSETHFSSGYFWYKSNDANMPIPR